MAWPLVDSDRFNVVIAAVFVAELVLRLASCGRPAQDFFRGGWNVRLMRFLPDGRVLALAVVKSIPSMFGMVVLTLVLLFVYQMIGWSLFGAALPDPGSCTLPARDRLRHRHSIDLRGDGHGPWDCRAVAAEGSTTR